MRLTERVTGLKAEASKCQILAEGLQQQSDERLADNAKLQRKLDFLHGEDED